MDRLYGLYPATDVSSFTATATARVCGVRCGKREVEGMQDELLGDAWQPGVADSGGGAWFSRREAPQQCDAWPGLERRAAAASGNSASPCVVIETTFGAEPPLLDAAAQREVQGVLHAVQEALQSNAVSLHRIGCEEEALKMERTAAELSKDDNFRGPSPPLESDRAKAVLQKISAGIEALRQSQRDYKVDGQVRSLTPGTEMREMGLEEQHKKACKAVQPPHVMMKVLMLLCHQRDDRLDLQKEQQAVEAGIRKGNEGGRGGDIVTVQLTVMEQPTFSEVTNKIKYEHFNVIHYSGHGTVAVRQVTLQFARVDNSTERTMGVVGTELFAEAIRLHTEKWDSSLECVVLNACHSNYQGEELITKGIPKVICVSGKVKDEIAASFAAMFYESIASGDGFVRAFDVATTDARAASGMHPQMEDYVGATNYKLLPRDTIRWSSCLKKYSLTGWNIRTVLATTLMTTLMICLVAVRSSWRHRGGSQHAPGREPAAFCAGRPERWGSNGTLSMVGSPAQQPTGTVSWVSCPSGKRGVPATGLAAFSCLHTAGDSNARHAHWVQTSPKNTFIASPQQNCWDTVCQWLPNSTMFLWVDPNVTKASAVPAALVAAMGGVLSADDVSLIPHAAAGLKFVGSGHLSMMTIRCFSQCQLVRARVMRILSVGTAGGALTGIVNNQKGQVLARLARSSTGVQVQDVAYLIYQLLGVQRPVVTGRSLVTNDIVVSVPCGLLCAEMQTFLQTSADLKSIGGVSFSSSVASLPAPGTVSVRLHANQTGALSRFSKVGSFSLLYLRAIIRAKNGPVRVELDTTDISAASSSFNMEVVSTPRHCEQIVVRLLSAQLLNSAVRYSLPVAFAFLRAMTYTVGAVSASSTIPVDVTLTYTGAEAGVLGALTGNLYRILGMDGSGISIDQPTRIVVVIPCGFICAQTRSVLATMDSVSFGNSTVPLAKKNLFIIPNWQSNGQQYNALGIQLYPAKGADGTIKKNMQILRKMVAANTVAQAILGKIMTANFVTGTIAGHTLKMTIDCSRAKRGCDSISWALRTNMMQSCLVAESHETVQINQGQLRVSLVGNFSGVDSVALLLQISDLTSFSAVNFNVLTKGVNGAVVFVQCAAACLRVANTIARVLPPAPGSTWSSAPYQVGFPIPASKQCTEQNAANDGPGRQPLEPF